MLFRSETSQQIEAAAQLSAVSQEAGGELVWR
jgi:hypothetical protein